MGKPLHDASASPEPALTFAEFYDAALMTPEVAVYVIRIAEDGGHQFEDANGFFCTVTGKSPAEIRGRPIEDVLLPEVAECLSAHLKVVIASRQPLAYERTLAVPGGPVSFKTSLIPIQRARRGVRFVLGLTRDVTHEATLVEDARSHAALLKALGIALPSALYVLNLEDYSLTFVAGEASESQLEWRRGAEAPGPDAGRKYFHPDDWPRAQAHWKELAELKDGEVCTISYRLLATEGEFTRHVHREIVLERNAEGKVKLVLGVSEDVSEQDKVEQEARDLSARMLTLQIEERRRIAQELHDSTVQHVSAAGLALGNARRVQSRPNPNSADVLAAIEDAQQCLDDAQHEIRVLSYLLHPPLLNSQGLAEAIEAFATGFGRRARLKIDLAISPKASEIDDDTAVHLFRVCQEGLTNVYRHANARAVKVTLEVDSSIRLTVQDDGVGINMPEGQILGLGLPGMQERMSRLGGSIKISGNPRGTTLVATLPRSIPAAA